MYLDYSSFPWLYKSLCFPGRRWCRTCRSRWGSWRLSWTMNADRINTAAARCANPLIHNMLIQQTFYPKRYRAGRNSNRKIRTLSCSHMLYHRYPDATHAHYAVDRCPVLLTSRLCLTAAGWGREAGGESQATAATRDRVGVSHDYSFQFRFHSE